MHLGITPPGSFYTPERKCPEGYSLVVMPRKAGQPITNKCIPKPAPAPVVVAPRPAPVTVSPTITVSPAMQQAFTPQFSPVLQQMQDSPYAGQGASPRQTTSPAQTATTPAPQKATDSMVPYLMEKLERQMELQAKMLEAERAARLNREIAAKPAVTTVISPVATQPAKPQAVTRVTAPQTSAPPPPIMPSMALPPTRLRSGPVQLPPEQPKKMNMLPLILIGGAALLLMNQPKQKTGTSK